MASPPEMERVAEGCNTVSPYFSFVIPGAPVPWARARGGSEFGGLYTAKPQRAFKKTVGDYCRIAMMSPRVRRIERPHAVRLSVRVFLRPPVSWQRSPDPEKRREFERAMSRLECIEKPDLDNWIKLPMDAIRGLAYSDDEQVISFPFSGKWWDPDAPRLEVDVWKVER